MTGPEDTPTVANPVTPNFQLTPPQVITPVPAEATRAVVPLRRETAEGVERDAKRLIDALLTQDLHSDGFRAGVDHVSMLGRDEIAAARSLMQGRMPRPGFASAQETAACRVIVDIRGQLDTLSPARRVDLLQPHKVLGIIPFGDRLKAYCREFDRAASPLLASLGRLHAARAELQKDIVDIEAARGRLWEAMQKLAAVAQLASALGHRLAESADALGAHDPQRAQALAQHVLPPARERLAAILLQQAACVSGYLALDVLKKAGREMMNGCNRVATTAVNVVAVVQTVARAAGHPMLALDGVRGAHAVLGTLSAEAGQRVDSHADEVAEFARNPTLGVDKMKAMFELAFKAVDAVEAFRAKVVAAAGHNDAIVVEQLGLAGNPVSH